MEGLHELFHHTEATLIAGRRPKLFLWVPPNRTIPECGSAVGTSGQQRLAVPRSFGKKKGKTGPLTSALVDGMHVPVEHILEHLVTMPLTMTTQKQITKSVAAWSAVAKLAVELVAGQNVVPWIKTDSGVPCATWRAALRSGDSDRIGAIAQDLPPAARASIDSKGKEPKPRLMTGRHAVRLFLDEAIDVLVRKHLTTKPAKAWTARFAEALGPGAPLISTLAVVEDRLPEIVNQWVDPGIGGTAGRSVRIGLRLDLPEDATGLSWPLTLVAESRKDPSLRIEAGEMWKGTTEQAKLLATIVPDLREAFLLELDRACRLWKPLTPCLDDPSPEGMILEQDQVVELLGETAALLISAEFSIQVPSELSVSGRHRLRARLRGQSSSTGGEGTGHFGLARVLSVRWEAALGDEKLSINELRLLAEAKQPLVHWRDRWIAVDPGELQSILALLEKPPQEITGIAAVRAAISGEVKGPGGRIGRLCLENGDELLTMIDDLRSGARTAAEAVPGLKGSLRPYQGTGTAWLAQLGNLGLGACLADDMGLGKTVQVIAHLLLRRDARASENQSLLVAPTSVVSNWKRELARFAPGIPVHVHHGADRCTTPEELFSAAGPGGVVITSFGLLRSDATLLASTDWDVAVLDEAQFIKNHQSKVAQAAFGLRARHRIALTGTPVENRLADLWSIFAFVNPGLLGGISAFKKHLATPIERFRDPQALERLQALTSPFILRRKKTDPDIAPDLPPRIGHRTSCTLTREQASLYKASLDSMMAEISSSEGMDRRGKVLALITALKQICNHPALFLREKSVGGNRSGKLDQLAEILESVFSEDEAALLFTQYRTMGDILVRYLEQRFAITAPFLHGGVARSKREKMVADFQDENGPLAMVVSVKAGGTGINLTRASHVVHVDRWWNPAVEAQATDRAHRIGQKSTVIVHTLVTSGTLEERIDRMLEEKADLAEVALSGGEKWLTELDDDSLKELLALDVEQTDQDCETGETS